MLVDMHTLFLAYQGTPLGQAAGGSSGAAPVAGTAAPGGAPGAGPTGAGGAAPAGNNTFFFLMLGMVAVLLVMMTLTSRRQKKARESLMSALKKHDRVITSSGIIGSVVEIKPRWIVLKVDESSNTRITFARESIQQILESTDATPSEAGT